MHINGIKFNNKVLDLGAMANPMFKMKGPNMINDSFAPHFPLKHAQKDMKYVTLPPKTFLMIVYTVLSNFVIFFTTNFSRCSAHET